MAGGSGERFWPLSTPERPKQLLRLTHPEMTMLEEAVRRVEPLVGDEFVLVATSSSIADAVRATQVVPEARLLSEPARRDTLGAIAWVVANLVARGEKEATVAILTSDHMIGEPERFRATVSDAMTLAEREGGIVTIGVPPTRPESGYGYVEADPTREVTLADGRRARPVRSFREKPSRETAEEFVRQGRFLWNSGMFFFTVHAFLEELAVVQPEASATLAEVAEALAASDLDRARRRFEALPKLSVDYAVMERARHAFVIAADFPWDDVGAWDALDRTYVPDGARNVLIGPTTVVDAWDNVVYNDRPGTRVGIVGVYGLVVVNTDQGVLVCPKALAQRVREVASRGQD
jgi:mannose-1-phosphate guanylyltransferase